MAMRRPELAIVIAVIAVSFSSILIRWAYAEDLEPLAIAFYRLLFNTLLLFPFVLLWQRDEVKELGRGSVTIMVLIGLVLTFHFSLWITSLDMTSVASSVILVSVHPILVGAVSHLWMKDRLTKLNLAGILIALSGVVLLTWGDFEGGSLTGTSAMGDILAFIAGMCAGIYILGGRKMRRDISLLTYAFLVYLFCTIFLFIACLVTSTSLGPLSLKALVLLILMALGPGILGHTLYNCSLKHVTATVVSVSLLGEPIGSSILAFLLLGEEPTTFVLLAGPFVLAGILMASMRKRKRRRKKPKRR